VGTPEDFGVFSSDQLLRGIIAASREYLPVDSSEIRDFDREHISVRRRAESCVEMEENYTEHLLQRSHEHYPYLRRHWFLDILCHVDPLLGGGHEIGNCTAAATRQRPISNNRGMVFSERSVPRCYNQNKYRVN
jgi:hypothetical protein